VRAAELAKIGHLGTHAFRHYAESRNMPNADFTMASCADLRINDSA
jgi:hypothetical protein